MKIQRNTRGTKEVKVVRVDKFIPIYPWMWNWLVQESN